MGKKKACAKKDPKNKGAKHDSQKRERARALFLGGETGPWAKKLAEAHDAEASDSAHAPRGADRAPAVSPGPDYSAPTSIDIVADPVLHALSTRRSISKVGPETPNDADLREIIRAISSVADHKGLRPWRFLIIRGDDRLRLGEALDQAAGERRRPGEVNEKPLRAELLLALVSSPRPNPKVPEWEQHATAAGAGHLLELALWQAGWGVMWRSGTLANAPEVRRLHRLGKDELLMGWFYIGSVPESYRDRLSRSTRPLPDPEQFLDTL
ncbi:nitroreductase [Brevibacterium sanguinis]|uniref:Nitroreductase n=2 Tax=Brevibacterium TaxID=1696 RepID=A0A366IEN6_9MICO|nr:MULTISPECIES: nitroreductase family protein [Brevibacterium]RBP63094.1 nitroreductase [Brevibacterium sanguinis]RBP69730.1 nitroreductase [Brevibacterium celere]